MPQPDYLVIGHVTQDQTAQGGLAIGGTAAYAARTAQAMSCRVGVVTSAAQGLELEAALPGVAVVCAPAPATTTFENRYGAAGRTQRIRALAAPLTAADIPAGWRRVSVVHLGPVAQECAPELADCFPSAFLGLTPQGWMRRWDEAGRVRPAPWASAAALLERADAVALSEEDIGHNQRLAAEWAARTRVLAVTHGAAGCTLYAADQIWCLPALPVEEVDATGAGDIFAAALFVRLWRGDSPLAAARLANCLAAVSVTRAGLAATPTAEEVARCASACREMEG